MDYVLAILASLLLLRFIGKLSEKSNPNQLAPDKLPDLTNENVCGEFQERLRKEFPGIKLMTQERGEELVLVLPSMPTSDFRWQIGVHVDAEWGAFFLEACCAKDAKSEANVVWLDCQESDFLSHGHYVERISEQVEEVILLLKNRSKVVQHSQRKSSPFVQINGVWTPLRMHTCSTGSDYYPEIDAETEYYSQPVF
jgi:hypothetical protein